MAASNKLLGQFNLENIPPAPRGMPQIEVEFDIDANGIVNVLARDKVTGKEQKITIQASGGLSDADVEKMVKDAEEHAEEDKKKRELVDSKNHADSLIFSTEKSLKEYGDKVSEDEKKAIEDAISELKSAAENDDAETIKAKTEALMQAAMKLGEAVYKAAQENPEGDTATAEASNKEEDGGKVVDVDYEEVDSKGTKKDKKAS